MAALCGGGGVDYETNSLLRLCGWWPQRLHGSGSSLTTDLGAEGSLVSTCEKSVYILRPEKFGATRLQQAFYLCAVQWHSSAAAAAATAHFLKAVYG